MEAERQQLVDLLPADTQSMHQVHQDSKPERPARLELQPAVLLVQQDSHPVLVPQVPEVIDTHCSLHLLLLLSILCRS